jgi:membrane-associated protein
MSAVEWILHTIREPGALIAYGYPVIALIIFVESAIFPFLPGDSLLVVAGIYAAKGDINLALLIAILIPCAVLGNGVAYLLGKTVGPRLFSNPQSRFFKPAYAQKAHDFYEKYGGSAIVIARFVPIVRTFVPVIAGIARMPYSKFVLFNITGGILWIVSMGLGGYFLGGFAASQGFPLDKHIDKVAVVVVILSMLPAIISFLRERGKASAAPKKV